MIINEDLKDIPVETMYKYLLRDYKALQQENKELKADVRRLLDMRFDEISVEDEIEVVRLTDTYKEWSKTRLRNEIQRLLNILNSQQIVQQNSKPSVNG